jgi:hypothetical protein
LVVARLGRARFAFLDSLASLQRRFELRIRQFSHGFLPSGSADGFALFDDAHGPPDIAALHVIRPNEFGTAFAA